MKNLLSFLLSSAILLSGCTQEEIRNSQPDFQDGRTFTASFEQDRTRTYVEDGNLLRWTAGDQISLFDGNTLNRQYKFDGETGDNSGTFSIVSKPFGTGNALNANYSVYPYSSDVKITETGVITATLPAEQSYAYDSFGLGANTMVAVTKDIDDTFLKFKNLCGYLKIRLYGDDITVKSISLTGNDNEGLAGKASVATAYGDEPKVVMSDEATSSITLNCGEGVKIGSSSETATAFWIAVPPTTFERGFEITVTDINGNTFTKSTSNEITVERNVIKPMKAFEVERQIEVETIPDNQIWYISSDGEIISPLTSNEYAGDFGASIISNTYENGKGIITFNGPVRSIGNRAFYERWTLIDITLPESVATIGDAAFSGCDKLNSITIPDNVTSLGGNAFFCCEKLATVTMGNNVKSIGENAFYNCSGLTSIIIGDNVRNIGFNAFRRCTGVSTLTLPSCIETIGDSAFADMQLTSMTCLDNYPPSKGDPFWSGENNNKIDVLCVPSGAKDNYSSNPNWNNHFKSIIEVNN